MTKQFTYDLIDCENRTWDGFDDFTETLTSDLKTYLQSNPQEHQTVKILFHYTSEGTTWLVNNLWFPDAIHKFSKKYRIPLANITFKSGSANIQKSYDAWHLLYAPDDDKMNVEFENFGFVLYGRENRYFSELEFTEEAPTHYRSHKYNCFNRNMLGHRQKFMLAMYENNLIDTETSMTSFHYWGNGVDDLPMYPVPEDLASQLPIQYDIKGDWQTAFDELFRIDPNHHGGDWNKVGDYRYIYENCYFTITTESSECFGLADYHEDSAINDYMREFHREMFITEKTTRPMLNLHPQILYCSTGTLDYLKSLGYKTFSNYWNEDYDNEVNPDKKLSLMIDTIKDVSSKSIEELHEMYWDMMPILKHNQELLLSQSAISWNP